MELTLVLALVFLVISIFFSMFGMGGGILYVPILLFAGFSMEQAPGISLILIAATSLAALSKFQKHNKVDWKLALVIDPPTDILAVVGGYYSAALSESLLRGILACLLVVAGTFMFKNRRQTTLNTPVEKHWWLWRREFYGERYHVNLPLVLTVSGSIGLLSGMLGVTGGLIKLPIMVLLCGVPMDIAVATSTVMITLTALSGLSGHVINGQVDWHTGLTLAIAAVVGGLVGGHISVGIDKMRLKKWFGIVMWLVALRIMFQLLS
ncbi:MAG: hypothetical protein B6I36_04755 [Desulfobacteraceae bacterium 4572_35.1]|nr:MAG: hypothetical protein B6I36_04755 [Desulfobacteraceae bacterium 4572_35.1]